MNRRTAAIALIASALFAGAPAVAEARPLPDPLPQHHVLASRDAALAYFVVEYRTAPLPDKRRIHNEITSILSDPQFAVLSSGSTRPA
ncbi:hypothetical protein [Terrabacter sp. 2RAF25]|uniref:hypothetical protein n=1 Tax=Terrabacter sp. 2RAF25 TaxID=3232998 RepID=UPI003F99899E